MAQRILTDDPVATRREQTRTDKAYRQKIEAAKEAIAQGGRPAGKTLDREGLRKLRFAILGA